MTDNTALNPNDFLPYKQEVASSSLAPPTRNKALTSSILREFQSEVLPFSGRESHSVKQLWKEVERIEAKNFDKSDFGSCSCFIEVE